MTGNRDRILQTDLTGRTAVVTGSSSGIGCATARVLSAAGAAVVVHARNSLKRAQAVTQSITESGGAATVLMADFSAPDQQALFVERAFDWRGGVDIWINNAGADVLTGEMAEASFETKLDRLLRVDVRATIQLARMVGHRMKQVAAQRELSGPAPVILNMGWDQARYGMAGDSGEMFAAAKGAVMAFTRSLARSLAPEVRVNCLAPGWIRTSWGELASEYWQERAIAESLLKRWGTAEDVARTARFLVSPAAEHITGQIVEVNGGFAGPR